MRRQGADLPDQDALGYFFEPQRGDHPIDVRLLGNDQLVVDPSCRLNQALAVFRHVPSAVKVLQLRLQIGETRPVLQSEPVHDGEVGLVDAVHVAGNGGRRDLRGVVVADVEHVIAFVLVGTDQFGLERDVVGQKCVRHDALAPAEVFARVPSLDCRIGGLEFLPVHAPVEHFQIQRIVREDRQPRDEVADPIVGAFQR